MWFVVVVDGIWNLENKLGFCGIEYNVYVCYLIILFFLRVKLLIGFV